MLMEISDCRLFEIFVGTTLNYISERLLADLTLIIVCSIYKGQLVWGYATPLSAFCLIGSIEMSFNQNEVQ